MFTSHTEAYTSIRPQAVALPTELRKFVEPNRQFTINSPECELILIVLDTISYITRTNRSKMLSVISLSLKRVKIKRMLIAQATTRLLNEMLTAVYLLGGIGERNRFSLKGLQAADMFCTTYSQKSAAKFSQLLFTYQNLYMIYVSRHLSVSQQTSERQITILTFCEVLFYEYRRANYNSCGIV